MLSRERVDEIQDIQIDNPLSSKTLNSRALPRLAANRVIKTKYTLSVRRQLQSFARDLTAYQTPYPERSLLLIVRQSHRPKTQSKTQGRFPRALTQRQASIRNDPRQWHLATNYQDNRLLLPQVSINDRGRDPLSDILLNATNIYPSSIDSTQYIQDINNSPSSHLRFVSPPGSQVYRHCYVNQPQRTRESISNTLRLKRTSISTISALLNYNNNTLTIAFTITQDLIQDSEDECLEPVSSVISTENSRFQQRLLIAIRSTEFR